LNERGEALTIGVRAQSGVARLHATLAALRANSGRAFRLVLVPDGPEEEIIGALREMREPQLPTREARGPGDCLARLVAAAETPLVVFLESGALVGPGWLDRLLAALERDPAAALVGPSTNGGPQAVESEGSSTAAAVARAARQVGGRFGDGAVVVAPPGALDGFCVVGRRDVLNESGVSATPGWMTDLNARLAERGRCSLWVRGAFVHQCTPFPPMLAFPRTRPRVLAHAAAAPAPPAPARPEGSLGQKQPRATVASSSLRVACIMPTRDRRAFVPRAIECFLRQDHASRELLILDDGADPVRDLVPNDPRIRYVRLDGPPRTIGAKRNLACAEAATADVIAHWDDDDWYPPWRLRAQVEAIAAGADVCGSSQLYYVNPDRTRAWRYAYGGGEPYVVGNTLAYRRRVWEASPFPDVQVGEDARFLRTRERAQLRDLANPALCVAMLHDGNTSPKHTNNVWWSPVPAANVLALVGEGAPAAPVSSIREERALLSACLVTWRRPANVRKIVERLVREPLVGEVLVWRNDPAVALDLPWPKVRVIDSPANLICHGRYLCAEQAAHPLVYVQDDDVLVHDVPLLMRQFQADPTRIHFNLSDWHYARRHRRLYGECNSALIGWGAIFPKDRLSVLQLVPEAVRSSPLFRREADQYFTMLLRRHHAPHRGPLTHLDGHSTRGLALWRAPEHRRMAALAVRDALRLIRTSHEPPVPPRWHVVATCHNYARYLGEAVESVMLNDADYELTIVDDESTDETPEIARALQLRYPHLRYLRLPRRSGVSQARNVGIGTLDSAFVALLDADDRFGPDYLFEAGRVLDGGADVANPDALLFGSESGRWPAPAASTLPMLLGRNSIHYCAAFRRKWWAEVGGFDEHIEDWEDYDFWIRVVAHGARVRSVAGDHFHYRRHARSRSSENQGMDDRLRRMMRARHEPLFAQHEASAERSSDLLRARPSGRRGVSIKDRA
jgi:glycosyltransferase involved in cell wall biosynthesis